MNRITSLSVLPLAALFVCFVAGMAGAEEPEAAAPEPLEVQIAKLKKATDDAKLAGDTAWMSTSSAFVMLMVPGLALFYGGMVRKKNVLATMMQSYSALAVVGLYWLAVGYGLAFGPSILKVDLLGTKDGGLIGWSWDLFFLKGIDPAKLLPNNSISVYTHVMFQGMFAIITPALISGALAERIRFWPFCIFMILWVTFVYCPLAHMVWAFDWFYPAPIDQAKELGASAIGLLGKAGALDFAGGTVVHIAAGTAGLAACLVLRRRVGYPEHTIQPNSMVLTLIGAGLLWFGWFGFNGGSATGSTTIAASAFAATQAAAAAAGLSWMLVEWLVKGKPTALGLASGIVAGLVAVTPASGFVYIWGGVIIGLAAGVLCYFTVALKSVFKYDDSLDAFGVHAVGGFLGAVLTGVFCYAAVNSSGADGLIATNGAPTQFLIQLKAAVLSAIFAFSVSLLLAFLTQVITLGNFSTTREKENQGLDLTEHGEIGFDLSVGYDSIPTHGAAEPKAAKVPPGQKRFDVVIEGVENGALLKSWSQLCVPSEEPLDADFKEIYPYVTTVQSNRFRLRGGDPNKLSAHIQKLFSKRLGKPVKVRVEE